MCRDSMEFMAIVLPSPSVPGMSCISCDWPWLDECDMSMPAMSPDCFCAMTNEAIKINVPRNIERIGIPLCRKTNTGLAGVFLKIGKEWSYGNHRSRNLDVFLGVNPREDLQFSQHLSYSFGSRAHAIGYAYPSKVITGQC